MSVFVFAGADHKVGVTQIVRSVGGKFAEAYPDKTVLIIPLDGKRGTDYIQMPFEKCLDDIRAKALSGVLTREELQEICVRRKNLFFMQGSRLANANKLYVPEFVPKVIEIAEQVFDVILIDAGADEKSALSTGAMQLQVAKILITTQQHLSSRNFDLKRVNVYAALGVRFHGMILNKFILNHKLAGDIELEQKYNMKILGIVPMVSETAGWMAEAEKESLALYVPEFDRSLREVAEVLAKMCGFEQQEQTKTSLLSRMLGRRTDIEKL